MIVGLGHAARTGKDSIAEVLVRDHGFTRVAFADALRRMARESHPDICKLVDEWGWEAAKTTYPEVRRYLIDLGNSARRNLGEDVWIRAVSSQIEPDRDYVITDVRYPNEVEWIQSYDRHAPWRRGIAVKVIRPGVEPLKNIADQALADFDGWDCVIENDGALDDLAGKAADLITSI